MFLVTPYYLHKGCTVMHLFVNVVGSFVNFYCRKCSLYMCLHVRMFVKDQFLDKDYAF